MSLIGKRQVWFLGRSAIERLASISVIFLLYRTHAFLILVALTLAMPDLSTAQTSKTEKEPKPVFIAPEIGIPSDRLGAGTRDTAEDLDGPLYLLSPRDGGYTSMAKPPLVWRITSGFRGTIQMQIQTIGGDGIVFERSGAFPSGYYAVDLERSDFSLAVGKTYRLSVSLVSQGETVTRASTLIERVQKPEGDPGRAGLWFDVLAPVVSIDLSGRVRVTNREVFDRLVDAGDIKQ